MLTDASRAFINELVLETFMEKEKKKTIEFSDYFLYFFKM